MDRVDPVGDLSPVLPPRRRTASDYFGIGLRGFCMGCADIVPGVSGGTMAFILGIYEELVESIRTLGRPEFLGALARFRFIEVFRLLNWPFLIALLSGIGAAVFTLSGILQTLLRDHPVYIWSFFFGLILASVFVVSQRITRWSPLLAVLLLLGAAGAFLIVGLVPVRTPETWWFLMVSGALASCALILPGISGAFLLVLLGKYQFVLGAVRGLEIVPIGFVGLGAVVGLVSFAQVLGWMFRRYHNAMIAVLTGLMLGSLRKVWPWKKDLAWLRDEAGAFVEKDGERIVIQQANLLPDVGGAPGEVAIAFLLALAAFVIVYLLDRLAGND